MASADQFEIAERLSRAALAAGAEAHDVMIVESASTSVGVRGGELEKLESHSARDVGLRVLMGQRQASVSGSDVSEAALDALAQRAVAMARIAPEDPHCGLADPSQLATTVPDLDLADPDEINPEDLRARAETLDRAASAVEGVSQAEGASAGAVRSAFTYLASSGFRGGWLTTRHTLGVSAFASRDGQMERDYDFHGQRYLSDLPSAEAVGRTAGERVIARLGARQMDSATLPVLFDRRVADGLLGAFLSAVSGVSVARGTSFLLGKMGERIFPKGMTLTDDPLRRRGLGSRPFDAEGLPCAPLDIVEDGVLRHWLLNLSTARKLGMDSTAHANRGVGSPPSVSPSNVHIPAGALSRDALMAKTGHGLLVSEMFGPSLNPNTGDYSVGVAGFAIRDGALAHPVSEITIAGNLLDMFDALEAADDLVWDGARVSPTVLVGELTVAGG